MNAMTNLSMTSSPIGWIVVAAVLLVLGIVMIVSRRRTSLIPNDEEEELPLASTPATEAKAEQLPASAAGEDDAMMAAMIGAIAASEEQGAILAAITAAISVVWESEYPGTGFRVVSYRHVDKRSPWNAGL